MPVGQVPESLRRTLVGPSAGVIRMAQPSLDGMALGKAADAPLSMGQRRVGGGGTAIAGRSPIAGGTAIAGEGAQASAAFLAMSVRSWEPSSRIRAAAA